MNANKTNNLSGLTRDASCVLAADEPVLIALRYKGSEASATYTVGSGDITLKHGDASSEAVDTTVGASGVVADGTYTTLGAMVDAINLSPNWEAWIVDGLRADSSTAALKTKAETTISPTRIEVVGLLADTSASLSLSRRVSARRLDAGRDQNLKRSVIERVRGLINTSGGEATAFSLLEVTPSGVTVRTLATGVGADNTEFDTGEDAKHYASDFGNDLLVRYSAANLPDTGAYLKVDAHIEE